MPAFLLPLALSGISALSGLFGNRKKQMETSSTSTQDYSGTETPQMTAQQMQMWAPLLAGLMQRTQGPDLGGYAASGMANINQAADVRNRVLQNTLAARGLSGSPFEASALAGAQGNRLSEMTNFLNTVPEKQWGMQGQALGQLQQLFQSLPFAVNRTGTSTTTSKGTQTQPGDMLGGGLAGLGAGIATGWGYNAQLQQELDYRKKLQNLGFLSGNPQTSGNPQIGQNWFNRNYRNLMNSNIFNPFG